MLYRLTLLGTVASLGMLTLATRTEAQTTSTAGTSQTTTAGAAPETTKSTNSAPSGLGLEDVVVTARRTQEALIDVPVSVTALTSKKLDALGLQQFKDLGDFTPGIIINSATSFDGRAGSNIIIRGMTPSVSPTASVFIDGVPVASGVFEGVDDVARVEILRGPQTAYFGRSVFAGAINFVTKTPNMENYEGRVSADVDDYALGDLRGQVEGPIVKDVLSFRLAGRYYTRDGTWKNSDHEGEFGDQQTKMIAGALRFTPTSSLSVNLYGYTEEDNDGPTTFRVITKPNLNCNAGANPGGAPNYFCGEIPNAGAIPLGANISQGDLAGFLPALNNPIANGSATTPVYRMFPDQPLDAAGLIGYTKHVHATAAYDAGPINFSILAGYTQTKHYVLTDLDYFNSSAFPNVPLVAGAPSFNNTLVRREDYFANWFYEARAATNPDKPLHGLLGVSYAVSRAANLVTVQLSTGSVITGGLGAINRTVTPAVFGSLTWDISPKLTISGEGRYQEDKLTSYRRSYSTNTDGTILINGVPSPTKIVAGNFKNFTPRIIAQYRPVTGTMLYASYSEGVNPGSFNTSLLNFSADFQQRLLAATGASLTVQPEKLANYEAGIKSQFWNNRAQIELSVYHAVWTNQIVGVTYQDPVPPVGNGAGTTVNVNIGRTILNGVEVEGSLRPFPKLELDGTFSYNGSDITSYVCVACRGYAGPNVSVIGNSLPLAPAYSASGSAQYTEPLNDNLKGYIRGDFFYKGSLYADETNLAYTHPQKVVNLRLGLQTPRARIEAFVTNLFNDTAPTSVARNSDLVYGTYEFLLGIQERRRIGLRVSYNFGS